ncbi:MAG: elongation factor P [Victivallales bacterium]|jgi:elongation factor P|nr:elongation factor P [Victivallales bacterium]MBR4220482.1 elongation factor P [Victivallales bacterium]
MLVKQFATGSIITVNNAPHIVENVEKHTPSARGAATIYKIRCRNLIDQTKTDLSCKGEDNFPEPDFRQTEVQFMYKEGDTFTFMDLENYDQYSLDKSIIGDAEYYLIEDMEGIQALILEERVVGIKLPDVVEQKLVECDPAIKGQSATNRGKSAKTETGLVIQVPEYMESGETVKIDTQTGKFLGRVGTTF